MEKKTTNAAVNHARRNALLRVKDLVDNPVPRVPICLCLDTSGSMGRTKGGTRTGKTMFSDGIEWNIVTGGISCISEMQAGIEAFYKEIREDETASYSAEIAIVTFDDDAVCQEDFANIERQEKVPQLRADGNTNMGDGVNLALDLLEKRKAEYKQQGVDYFQPWLVLMTDGTPNGDTEALERAVLRTQELVKARKLTVFPIAIGDAADIETLGRFSPDRSPLRLQGADFKNFFAWLSESVVATSQSMPGEDIELDIERLRALVMNSEGDDEEWRVI